MSTEPKIDEKTAQAVAALMDGTPDEPGKTGFEVIQAVAAHEERKAAERKRTFTADEAARMCLVDFDLEDRQSWPAGMLRGYNPEAELNCFQLDSADDDIRLEALRSLVFASISPIWAYCTSLVTAIQDHCQDPVLVWSLASCVDVKLGALVDDTVSACGELIPKIAAVFPSQTVLEMLREIYAENEQQRASRAQEASK